MYFALDVPGEAYGRDFPAWSTVYGYFWRWSKDGTWLKIHGHSLAFGLGWQQDVNLTQQTRSS